VVRQRAVFWVCLVTCLAGALALIDVAELRVIIWTFLVAAFVCLMVEVY
jgi:hypothetical protein